MAFDRDKILASARKKDEEEKKAKIKKLEEAKKSNVEKASNQKASMHSKASSGYSETSKTNVKRAGIETESNVSPTIRRTGNMRADAEMNATAQRLANLSESERQAEILKIARENPLGVKGYEVILENDKKADDKAWEKAKTDYNTELTQKRASAVNDPMQEKYRMLTDKELIEEEAAQRAKINNYYQSDGGETLTKAKEIGRLYSSVKNGEDFEEYKVNKDIDYLREQNGYASRELTERYKTKFYSMSNEERELVAKINAENGSGRIDKEVLDAKLKLQNEYGYSADDVNAMVYFYDRYANARKAQKETINSRAAMDENPLLESFATVGANVFAGPLAAVGIVDSYRDNKKIAEMGITGEGLDYNNKYSSAQRYVQDARKQFTDTHDYEIGDFDVADFAYNTAMSGLDSFTAGKIGGRAALPLLGSNVFSAGAAELSKRGLSDEQALTGGIAQAAFEMIFEHFSIGTIIDEVDAKTVKDVVLNIAKGMAVNLTEEAATETANIIYDTIAHGDKSERELKISELVNNGMDRKSATKEVLKGQILQVFEAGASGAFMGAGFSTMNSVPSYAASRISVANDGAILKNASAEGAVIAEGMAAPLGSKANNQAQKLSQKSAAGKKITDYQLGRLNEMNDLVRSEGKITEGSFKGIDSKEALAQKYEELKVREGTNKSRSTAANSRALQRLDAEYKSALQKLDKADVSSKMTEAFKETHKNQLDNEVKSDITNPTIVTEDGKTAILDGKNYDMKTQSFGEFKGVYADKDGDAAMMTTNGTEIKLSEAASMIENPIVRKLYEEAKGMSPERANAYISEYRNEHIDEYTAAADYYYKMGSAGLKASVIERSDNGFGEFLSPEARTRFANLGAAERPVKVGFTDMTVQKKTLSEKIQFYALEQFAKENGIEIMAVDSIHGINGAFRQNTNRIIVSRDTQTGVFGITVGHEALHQVKHYAKESGQELINFVVDKLEKQGADIEAEIQKLRDRGYTEAEYSREDILEEIAANNMFDVFTNEDFIREYAFKNHKVLAALEKVFSKAIKAIESAVAKYSTMSEDSSMLIKDKDTLMQIRTKMREALNEARVNREKVEASNSETVKKSIKENATGRISIDTEGVVEGKNGESLGYNDGNGGTMLSLKTYREGGREYYADQLDDLVKKGELDSKDAESMLNELDRIYDICREKKERFEPFSAWSDAEVVVDQKGNPLFSVIKKNGEYAMNLDFSLVCKKRRTLDAVLNKMIKEGIIGDVYLGAENIVKINEIIRKHGFETACALCFVDAKRFRQGSVSDTFVNMFNDMVKNIIPKDSSIGRDYHNFGNNVSLPAVERSIDKLDDNELDLSYLDKIMKEYSKGKVEYKIANYLKKNPQGRKLLHTGDFIATEGFQNALQQYPEIMKLYNMKKGSGGPKAAYGDVQYLNDILKRARTFDVNKAYSIGGVRVQSFSDFVPRMIFDYIQMFSELSAMKLPAHSYTKEEAFVKIFGLSGIKINMSLIPAVAENGVAPGLDSNGNYLWADESFNFKTAVEIQNSEGYSLNCGTICVGISDEHIRKLMADPDIRMVIPYHKSGINPIVAEMIKTNKYTDYTLSQSERYESSGKNITKKDHNKIKNFNELLRIHKDPQIAAQAYVRACEKNGFLPKFDQFVYKRIDGKTVVDESGNKVIDENYYKLLEDFNSYDKGAYAPQTEVKMNFPSEADAFGSLSELIEKALDEDAILEGERSGKIPEIVDEIKNTLSNRFVLPKNDFSAEADASVDVRELAKGDGLKLSMKTESGSDVNAYYAEVIRENRSLQMIISALEDAGMTTVRGTELDGKDISRIAGKVLRERRSTYDKQELTDKLTVIFDYLANNQNINAEETMQMLCGICNEVLQKSEYKDTEQWEQYAEVRDYLKNTEIYISEALKNEIIFSFGDYKTFRGKLMGKAMRLTTTNSNAPTLEEVWENTLSSMAPDYFRKGFNEKNMPVQLTRFFEIIAPKTANRYDNSTASIEDEAIILATEIMEEAEAIKRLKNKGQKYNQLIIDNRRVLADAKAELKKEFRDKADKNLDGYKKRLTEYREKREDTERRRVLRNNVERNINYLNRRIENETNTEHIPEHLKELVSSLLECVPKKGEAVSRDKLLILKGKLSDIKNYDAFTDNDDSIVDVLREKLSVFEETIIKAEGKNGKQGFSLAALSQTELKALDDVVAVVKHAVKTENQLFNDQIKARRDMLSMNAYGELTDKKDSKVYDGKGSNKRHLIDEIKKGLTKPEYLFENLGSETVAMLYREIRKGENIQAKIVHEARVFEKETKKKHKYDTQWSRKDVEVELISGTYKMSVENLIALYATFKRKQGLEHLLGGGAVVYTKKQIDKEGRDYNRILKDNIRQLTKEARKNGRDISPEEINNEARKLSDVNFNAVKEIEKSQRIYFNEDDINAISNALTTEQKLYADEMVGYMTNNIGSLRNEISMKLYGIERYKENYYFPIKVDRNFLDSKLGKVEGVSTIKNQSSAQRTVNKASNPIEISGFTEVFNQHVYDSALYCAYVLPIEDFKKVYNFRGTNFNTDGVESLIAMREDFSVKEELQRVNGKNATKEIEQFMIALDSGSRYENLMPISAKLASRSKKVAVMANLSVAVQQPTAIYRSMLYISPKHFGASVWGGPITTAFWASKSEIEEMKRWNGCARIKEIGYFDVNMGRTATDYMNEFVSDKDVRKEWSIKDHWNNIRDNGMMTIDQKAGWLSEKADEKTWGAIWKACKKQVKAENEALSGDALNEAAAELFQTVISKTQVYDSVFTKPEYMRRKEGFSMMMMQFMSEPLTSLNMLAESVAKARNAEEGNKAEALKFCGRAFGCFLASTVINNVFKSIIYTMRDDEEDESFLEKYIANVIEGIPSDVVGMFPYIKEIFSIVQGYDLSRMDVSAFSTFGQAVKDLGSENKTGFEKILSVLKAAGQLSGIPVYNVMRDAEAIAKISKKIANGIQNGFVSPTKRGTVDEIAKAFSYIPGIEGEPSKRIAKGQNIEKAFYATLEGDTAEFLQNINELKAKGYSDDVISKALTSFKNEINKEIKADPRAEQAATARYQMDYDEYERLIDELTADGYNRQLVINAVDSMKVELISTDKPFSIDEKDLYSDSYDFKNAIMNGTASDIDKVYNKIVEAEGEDTARKEMKSSIKSAYKNGYISITKAEEYLDRYKSADAGEHDVFWEVEELKAGSDDYSKYGKLNQAIESGEGIEVSIDYYTQHGVTVETVRKNITSQFKPKLLSMERNSAEFNEVYENVIYAFVATGKTSYEATKQVRKWFE